MWNQIHANIYGLVLAILNLIAKQLTLKKSTPYDRAALELPEGFWWAYPMTVPMVTDKYFTTITSIIQENKIDSQ